MRAIRAIALACSALIIVGVGMSSAGATNTVGTIRGAVVDAPTNTLLYTLCVKAVNESDATIVRASETVGSYMLSDVPPGVYDVSAQSCPGTVPAYGPDVITGVTVTAGSTTQVSILRLHRAASPFPYGSVAGAVFDATTGAALAGICVTGPPNGIVARPTAVTGTAGTYRFDNVVPLSNAEAEFRDCPNAPQIHQATSVHMIVNFGPIVTNMPAATMTLLNPPPPPTKPATPTDVHATRSRKSATATVTWAEAAVGGTPPSSGTGGTATSFVITAYSVGSPKVFGTPVTVTGAGARSGSVGGLRIGHRYSFTVTAVNTVGASAPSAPSNRV